MFAINNIYSFINQLNLMELKYQSNSQVLINISLRSKGQEEIKKLHLLWLNTYLFEHAILTACHAICFPQVCPLSYHSLITMIYNDCKCNPAQFNVCMECDYFTLQ